jgi:hypothetical protein
MHQILQSSFSNIVPQIYSSVSQIPLPHLPQPSFDIHKLSQDQLYQLWDSQRHVSADQWISRASTTNDIGGSLAGLAIPEIAQYSDILSPGYAGLRVLNTARETYKNSGGSVKETLIETSNATLFHAIASIGLPLYISRFSNKHFQNLYKEIKKPAWVAKQVKTLSFLSSAVVMIILAKPINDSVSYLLNRYYRPWITGFEGKEPNKTPQKPRPEPVTASSLTNTISNSYNQRNNLTN